MAVVIVLVAGGSGKGKEPREWKASVQPQVLLSLLEVLSLVALGVGFLEGLAVVFWGVLGRGCAVRFLLFLLSCVVMLWEVWCCV